jgi:hypothetical protein
MSQIFIEGTSLQQQRFDHATGEIPITVHDGGDGMTPAMVTAPRRFSPGDRMHDDDPYPTAKPVATVGAAEHVIVTVDDFESAMQAIDENPIVTSCDLANPESCESCT